MTARTALAPVPPELAIRSGRALAGFFALTFAWTWGLWWISALIKPTAPGLSGALFLASAFGPGLAAMLVTLRFDGVAGLRLWFTRCLKWRVGWRWYAYALLVPPLIMLAALVIHSALGGTVPAFPDAGRLLMAIAQFPLILAFGGPLGEEFGWRGYALPTLAELLGWRWASVIVGMAWSLWHVPLLLMADTAQADLPMALFVASTIGLSIVMARLSVNTSFSVLPAILLHSVINWCSMVFPIMPAGGDTRAYALVAGITIVVALVALLKLGTKANSRR